MPVNNRNNALVYTIEDRCRVCYTCVRECPARAIQIIRGQAQVINDRCIACGNCTKVCSQGAKVYQKSIQDVITLPQNNKKVIAIIAPSFPAEFDDLDNHKQFVGMIKALGFNYVLEVSFGADLIAREYKKLFQDSSTFHISSDCPAIARYIELYYPHLVENLAPIESPMVAISKVARMMYGDDTKIVFIGPCLAKKEETDLVDEVLTFTELRELFKEKGISPKSSLSSDFDPPYSGKGSIFPISRGLVQTADIEDDIINGNVIIADGKKAFQEAVKEFDSGTIHTHLELLCCEGCVMGPGMSPNGNLYKRNSLVSNYVKEKINTYDEKSWEEDILEYSKIDFSTKHTVNDQRLPRPTQDQINDILQKMGKSTPEDHLNCGACGYDTCEEHAIAIIEGLAENEMCLPYTIDKLHSSIQELAVSNDKLVSVQQALNQSEKLANMGQLSAGIAHELNNPLGVIIMYSNILLEECPKDSQMMKDLKLIVEQGNRCKKIVGGLLNFARKNQVNKKEIDIKKIIKLSLSSVIIPQNIDIKTSFKLNSPIIALDKEQIVQSFSNLMKNGIEAMQSGGKLNIQVSEHNENMTISISDTGHGIEQNDLDKIFEPFYTTKEIGIGTGLGLATTYGIIKMHKGNITVESNTDKNKGETGTTFTITLPKNKHN